VDLRQPLIVQNVCNRWKMTDNKKWELVEQGPLDLCTGIFGVTAEDFVLLRDYSRRLESWIGQNCGSNNNGHAKKSTK
jgi:hypothetical protein